MSENDDEAWPRATRTDVATILSGLLRGEQAPNVPQRTRQTRPRLEKDEVRRLASLVAPAPSEEQIQQLDTFLHEICATYLVEFEFVDKRREPSKNRETIETLRKAAKKLKAASKEIYEGGVFNSVMYFAPLNDAPQPTFFRLLGGIGAGRSAGPNDVRLSSFTTFQALVGLATEIQEWCDIAIYMMDHEKRQRVKDARNLIELIDYETGTSRSRAQAELDARAAANAPVSTKMHATNIAALQTLAQAYVALTGRPASVRASAKKPRTDYMTFVLAFFEYLSEYVPDARITESYVRKHCPKVRPRSN